MLTPSMIVSYCSRRLALQFLISAHVASLRSVFRLFPSNLCRFIRLRTASCKGNASTALQSISYALFSSRRGCTSLCGNCVALAKCSEFHDAFACPAKLWTYRSWICSKRASSLWSEPPHPRQVQRGGGQGKLRGHFPEPAHPEPPHPSLLFQNSDDRLGHCFSPSVHCLPGRGT